MRCGGQKGRKNLLPTDMNDEQQHAQNTHGHSHAKVHAQPQHVLEEQQHIAGQGGHAEGARTQPARMQSARMHGGTQFVALSERHPAHAATWNQVGQVTYQAPSRQQLTATACLGRLHASLAGVNDVAKRTAKKKAPKEPPGQTGSLDPVDAGQVAKSYNVKLQLADASESSGPPKDLDPNDVPAWRTKMCENRIAVLQTEKRKLRQKERDVQREIERKTALRNRAAADLTWKKKEIGYVGETITDFRKELAQREQVVQEHIDEQRAAILEATHQVGVEKREKQKAREAVVYAVSECDLAERRRRNQETAKESMVTLADLFATIAAANETNGIQMREQRVKNTETIADVAQKDLERLQKMNETVKKESALSAQRLREKIERTQKQRSEEYIANRTAQFNDFKKAAMVTQRMQAETGQIIEQLRGKYEATRELERKLSKI